MKGDIFVLIIVAVIVSVGAFFLARSSPQETKRLFGTPTIEGLKVGDKFRPNSEWAAVTEIPRDNSAEKSWWMTRKHLYIYTVSETIREIAGPTLKFGDFTFTQDYHSEPFLALLKTICPKTGCDAPSKPELSGQARV